VATTAEHLVKLTADTRSRVTELLSVAASEGSRVSITSSLRSCAEQQALHDKGITPVSGCRSWHVHGRAVDLYAGSWEPAAYARLGEAWEKMGGIWGGRWGDHVHFEWHPGMAIDELCPEPGECPRASTLAAVGKGFFVAGLALGLWVVLSRKRR
jgi:hypothetical protein